MSRVGNTILSVPSSVTVTQEVAGLALKGKASTSFVAIPDCVRVVFEGNKISLKPVDQDQKTRALWGTTNRLLRNAITGLDTGFRRELEISGVGYRAAVQGSTLVLQLGFSHDIHFPIPSDVKIVAEKPTTVVITGASKQRVGQVAAEIRSMRPPEPYKGKGIRYSTETVRRKEGKKK